MHRETQTDRKESKQETKTREKDKRKGTTKHRKKERKKRKKIKKEIKKGKTRLCCYIIALPPASLNAALLLPSAADTDSFCPFWSVPATSHRHLLRRYPFLDKQVVQALPMGRDRVDICCHQSQRSFSGEPKQVFGTRLAVVLQ